MSMRADVDDAPSRPGRDLARALLANPSFTLRAMLVAAMAAMAFAADWLAPFAPLRGNFRARMVAPGAPYWLGTDHFGRDILSRIMHGAKLSLWIGLAVMVVTGFAGTAIGAVAGYFRALDGPIMRLMDAFMAFPPIILAIAISAVLGGSVTNVVIALSIAATPHTARIVRAVLCRYFPKQLPSRTRMPVRCQMTAIFGRCCLIHALDITTNLYRLWTLHGCLTLIWASTEAEGQGRPAQAAKLPLLHEIDHVFGEPYRRQNVGGVRCGMTIDSSVRSPGFFK